MSTLAHRAAYDDQQGAFYSAAIGRALTVEAYRNTNSFLPYYRHDRDDYLTVVLQFTHRKRLGSALASVHLHYIPEVPLLLAAQNVYFYYEYSWQTTGGVFPALATWTTGNATLTINPADVYKHLLFNIVTNVAAPANEGYSSIMVFTLARLGTSGLDTFTTAKSSGTAAANLAIIGLDQHLIVDRSGSLREGSE